MKNCNLLTNANDKRWEPVMNGRVYILYFMDRTYTHGTIMRCFFHMMQMLGAQDCRKALYDCYDSDDVKHFINMIQCYSSMCGQIDNYKWTIEMVREDNYEY